MYPTDWSAIGRFNEHKNTCRCGAVYSSHVKYSFAFTCLITRKPCPQCGSDRDIRKSEQGPDVETLHPDDVVLLPEESE